jgi:hypothetical protein
MNEYECAITPAGEAPSESAACRVLSIDLDVFVSPAVLDANDDSPRPDKRGYRIKDAEQVGDFLRRCRLDSASPTRGVVVEHHVELFHWLQKMISSGSLAVPFDLVHADAHADMTSGFGLTPLRIITEVLHRPPAERAGLAAGRVNSTDWLAWAIACRWLRSVVHVRQDADPYIARDYPPCWVRAREHASGIIAMVALSRSELYSGQPKPTSVEPQVEFSTCELDQYRSSGRFDLVAVCHSPAFVPTTGDALLPILKRVVQSA